MQHSTPGTPLPFVHCENFRELGGYQGHEGKQVKHGVFYRAPALANLSNANDIALFESLGIQTVFDFRSTAERAAQPDPVFEGTQNIAISAILDAQGKEVNFDLQDIFTAGVQGVENMLKSVHESYLALPFGNPAYQALFAEIARQRTPLLFHCTAGKDRTGVAAALILKALGVSNQDIVADYLITNACRAQGRAQLTQLLEQHMPPEKAAPLADVIAGVQAQSMEDVLNAIDTRYPHYPDFLAAECNFSAENLTQMCQTYLERA